MNPPHDPTDTIPWGHLVVAASFDGKAFCKQGRGTWLELMGELVKLDTGESW